MNWNELKKQGSDHYKTEGVEPVDLYLSGGMFNNFALACIIKYAFRNRIDVEKIKKYIKNCIDILQNLDNDPLIRQCKQDLKFVEQEISKEINDDDMEKIIDYARKLKASKQGEKII